MINLLIYHIYDKLMIGTKINQRKLRQVLIQGEKDIHERWNPGALDNWPLNNIYMAQQYKPWDLFLSQVVI